MKVLLFSHVSDIDGMGSVILAKLSFKEVEYVLCETFELKHEIEKYIKNKRIYNFDKIFITDLFLQEPLLTELANDNKLKNKLFVFDHHESFVNDNKHHYSFVTLRIKDDIGLCSGTSLFYEYLIKNNYIEDKKIYKDFSELTRKYDTWEWITIYNDGNPHKLTLLFDVLGPNNYIEWIYNKLKNSIDNNFTFNDIEDMLINNKLETVKEKMEYYIKNVFYENLDGLKVGIMFIEYQYRNDLAEYIRKKQYDIDLVMLISLERGVISYRSIKEDVNVRLFAEKMGGKGHDKAASSPISKEQKEKLIKIFLENK